jgi:hypothetical protein
MDVPTYLVMTNRSGESEGRLKIKPDGDGPWIMIAIAVWLALGWIFVCNVLSGNLL